MTSHNKAKVAIYIRVSTLHQIDKDSLPMQRSDLISYAKLILNTDDFTVFEDAGYSGKNTLRPKFQEMMSLIRDGAFTHLLVWKIDRISRNLLDFASMYTDLKKLGIVFISKNEQFDTSTAIGEAMLKIILVFAELERNMTVERVTATMISRASNGLWNGGNVPYGYTWDSEKSCFFINEEEATIVRLIHDRYEENRSLTKLVRYLNESHCFTKKGCEWSHASIMNILKSVFYCGEYLYNQNKSGIRSQPKKESEWVSVPDHHPAIISREQKERIIAVIKSNQRLHPNIHHSHKYAHIFSGLLFCSNCNKPMTVKVSTPRKGWRYSSYSCPTRRARITDVSCKFTSDSIIGEFIFNYVLNIINLQSAADSIFYPKELQEKLLYGDTFNYIAAIEPADLKDFFDILKEKRSQNIYGKGSEIPDTPPAKSGLSILRSERSKLERALQRLISLYLYDDKALPESEFLTQKLRIENQLEEIDKEIMLEKSNEESGAISDETFIKKASEFIIAQKLTNRKYINYKRLAASVNPEVLQSFVQSIIDCIVMDAGKIKQIKFKNGLSHTFIFK